MHYDYAEEFTGIGAWGKALRRVTKRHGDTCEVKWYAEINKFASNAYAAIHGVSEDLNIWDITKDVQVKKVDIVFYSPPCTEFSTAGNRKGTESETGMLFYHALEKIEAADPDLAIMENVDNLANEFEEDMDNMIDALSELGYTSKVGILNAKDYGIPQKRKRLFIVSGKKDLVDNFKFPTPIGYKYPYTSYLEKNVDEKYYKSKEWLEDLTVKEIDKLVKEQPQLKGCIALKNATKDGFIICGPGAAVRLDNPQSKTGRGRVSYKEIMTLTTQSNVGYWDGERLRELTPLERFRLSGFDDEDYYKAKASFEKTFGRDNSDSQMNERSGNTIVVNVIEEILENLLYDRKQDYQQLSLF